MTLLRRLFPKLRQRSGLRSYTLEEPLHTTLISLAEQQGRSLDELAADLLAAGLARQHTATSLWQRWLSLSPREQDVSALTCLGYTNRQIAARLGISDETVKTHLQNTMVKFDLHGKSELRMTLAGWDFSAWETR